MVSTMAASLKTKSFQRGREGGSRASEGSEYLRTVLFKVLVAAASNPVCEKLGFCLSTGGSAFSTEGSRRSGRSVDGEGRLRSGSRSRRWESRFRLLRSEGGGDWDGEW